jgi:hypothetical protein
VSMAHHAPDPAAFPAVINLNFLIPIVNLRQALPPTQPVVASIVLDASRHNLDAKID